VAYYNYKQNLLNHFKDIQPALERVGAEASLNARNFRLEVRAGTRTYTLLPQFLKVQDGRRQYTPDFDADVQGFVGWYPYFNRRWELSTEKLKFKAYASANGLATPEYSTDPAAAPADVVVKKSVSSFSQGVSGPFRSARERALEDGEFYERFLPGRSVKIFYVENRPICLELEAPATVKGDGRRTIRQLLSGRAKRKQQPVELKQQSTYLRFVGKSLGDVLPLGAIQQVDFRYGSVFNLPADLEYVHLERDPRPELEPQLRAIGEQLLEAIPKELRAGTFYTADAILDDSGKLWLLEMNSNPYIHPWAYTAMLESLLRVEPQAQPAAPRRAEASDPQSANETFQLAMAQFSAGATAQAIALWHRVLQAQPGHAGALYHIGFACARESRTEEARRALETLIYTVPPDNAYFPAARQLLNALAGSARPEPAAVPGAVAASRAPRLPQH
jgi:tetratricopeptide (TPR) repeat protein